MMRSITGLLRALSTLGVLGMALTSAPAATFGPTPYLSATDSPFTGTPVIYSYLENFEDGLLNTPGVTGPVGVVVATASALTDSVDADDGALDGLGQTGRSLYSSANNVALASFEFQFSAAALGALPSHVGIVWTDVGNVTSGSFAVGDVRAEAFDSANQSLGVIGPVTLGDGSAAGQTAEDRFFGFSHLGGISRFVIAMDNSVDWEVDHLQYQLVVPEPTTFAYAVLGVSVLVASRRLRLTH